MINKLLIMILSHKKQKLVYRNCGICSHSLSCDYCNIYFIQRDINDVIRHLKEEKYDNMVSRFILQIQSKET